MDSGGSAFEQAVSAAEQGDLEALDRALRDDPEALTTRADDGDTLLGLACRAATSNAALPPKPPLPGPDAAIDRILAAGADPSVPRHDGATPLHVAALGHPDLVRRLLAAGADTDGRLMGVDGGTPLSLALFYAQTETAELLADPPRPDNLRTAAALGRDLERFVNGDALTPQAAEGTDFYRPIPLFPPWQRTCSRQELLDEALCWAARNDQCASMARLCELGADVNANPYRGTPLLWAIYADKVAAAEWLLDHGADPDLRHDFGGEGHGVQAVAMHLAAQYESLRCLTLLLDRGADPTIRDAAYDSTPLGWAEHLGGTRSAALLRRRG